MKKILLILVAIAFSFTSCERIDFGDTNVNPYEAQEGNSSALMRGAMGMFASNGDRTYYSNVANYAQYQAEVTYTDEQIYSQYSGAWYRYYISELMPLKEVIETATEPSGSKSVNMSAIADIFSVMIWKRITDTFGDIPYTEALQGSENIVPKYTTQKDIYLDLLARLKTSRDAMDANAWTPGSDADIMYGGDISKWGKLANSLILSVSLQLSGTSEAAAGQAAFNEALNNTYGVIEDNADNLVFIPDGVGNFPNPLSRSRSADYSITKELVESLNGSAGPWGAGFTDPKNVTSNHTPDLRVSKYATTPTGSDAIPYGYRNNQGQLGEPVNDLYKASDANFTIMSATYTYLNRAEGALIFASGEDANAMLTSGIIKSFEFAGLTNADGTAQAAIRVADAANAAIAPGGLAQVIGEEKWFALFPDAYGAWAEQRRTGFPELHASPDAVNGGVIPHRMLYPTNAKQVNPNGWQGGVNTLAPAEDANTSKIWWEQ